MSADFWVDPHAGVLPENGAAADRYALAVKNIDQSQTCSGAEVSAAGPSDLVTDSKSPTMGSSRGEASG